MSEFVVLEQPGPKTRSELTEKELSNLTALFKRCERPKVSTEDINALKKAFVEVKDLWQAGGNLARNNINRMLDEAFSGPNYTAVKESHHAAIRNLKNELGYQDASLLEKLLIDEIAFNWLAHSFNENKYSAVVVGNVSLAQGDFWERRMLASQKRYLRAIESLARIRKLARPDPAPVQVNIAEKQVNIAASGSVKQQGNING